MPRNLDLSPSGAVVSSDLAVLIAEVRAFTAPERAASMQRTPSTHPSWLLGVPSLECVSSRGFEQKEHRKLNSLSIGSAHAF